MSDGVTIEWPKADVDALFRAMDRAQKELNYGVPRVLNAAAMFVKRSLGTSARVAPKTREYKETTDIASGSKAPRRGLTAYDITGWFGSPRSLQTKTIFVKSKSTMLRRRDVKITNRGLAKASWGLGRLSESRLDPKKYLSTAKKFSGPDQYIQINNSLRYIQDALTGGPKDVNTAIARAGEAMSKSIEKQLVKKMGAS